jgi:hypothetical protein
MFGHHLAAHKHRTIACFWCFEGEAAGAIQTDVFSKNATQNISLDRTHKQQQSIKPLRANSLLHKYMCKCDSEKRFSF